MALSHYSNPTAIATLTSEKVAINVNQNWNLNLSRSSEKTLAWNYTIPIELGVGFGQCKKSHCTPLRSLFEQHTNYVESLVTWMQCT